MLLLLLLLLLLLDFPLLGSAVLKPNFNLPLGEPKCGSQLTFPPDGDVSTKVKLLLQLQPLMVCVHHPVFVFCPGFHCGGRRSFG